MARTFASTWEPTKLSEEVLERGAWRYDNEILYTVELLRQKWDYSRTDLESLESMHFDSYAEDFIDYAINDDGETFVWKFMRPDGVVESWSPGFGSEEAARNHMQQVYKNYTKVN